MMLRFTLVVLLSLLCAQGTLTANTSFGASTNVSFATNAYVEGSWTEVYTGGAGTTEQIDCLVAILNISNTCGSPGPGSSNSISIPAFPGNSGILPSGTTNYLETDGDPSWGAPVWTNMTGLTVGDEYELSFYQATNEEDGNNKEYNDRWEVYLIPGAAAGSYICPVCSTPVNPLPGDLAYTSPVIDNTGAESTPWELETYTFAATNTSEILEFVTDAVATSAGAFAPPFLDLAGVTVTPEPGSWALTILGVGVVLAACKLRRRSSARG